MRKKLAGLLIAAGLVMLMLPASATTTKVTICHAAGLDGTTHYETLTIGHEAVYGPAGHFYENGTPRAGHEHDYLGKCQEDEGTTTTVDTTTSTLPPSTSTPPPNEPSTTTTIVDETTTTVESTTTTVVETTTTEPDGTASWGANATCDGLWVEIPEQGIAQVDVYPADLLDGTYDLEFGPSVTFTESGGTTHTIAGTQGFLFVATPAEGYEAVPTQREILVGPCPFATTTTEPPTTVSTLPFTGPDDSLPAALAGMGLLGLGATVLLFDRMRKE